MEDLSRETTWNHGLKLRRKIQSDAYWYTRSFGLPQNKPLREVMAAGDMLDVRQYLRERLATTKKLLWFFRWVPIVQETLHYWEELEDSFYFTAIDEVRAHHGLLPRHLVARDTDFPHLKVIEEAP